MHDTSAHITAKPAAYAGLAQHNAGTALTAHQRRAVFLARLLELGDVAKACEAAGVPRTTLESWKQHHPGFKSQMRQTREATTDRVLGYIKSAYRTHGNFPTVREIMAGMALSSTSMAICYLRMLEEGGRIVNCGTDAQRRYTLPEVLDALKGLR